MSHAEQIEALKGLLKRVRRATRPNEDLDADIYLGLGILTRTDALEGHHQGPIWRYHDAERQTMGSHSPMVRTVTGSVDGALALVHRALPGTMWATGCMEGGPFCRLVYPTGVNNGWGHTVSMEQEGGPPTEPLAILSALLSAKLALLTQEEGR